MFANTFQKKFFAALAISCALFVALPAYAALNNPLPADGFMRDFKSNGVESHSFSRGKTASLYKKLDEQGYGFNVRGVLGSNDRAATLSSGLLAQNENGMVDLERKAKLTTLLVSGSYDLKKNLSDSLPIRPYVVGGVGLALYDTSSAATSLAEARTDMVPVLHLGGGLAYRMGEDWDLSVAYKAGFANNRKNGTLEQSNHTVDVQLVDVSFKYTF